METYRQLLIKYSRWHLLCLNSTSFPSSLREIKIKGSVPALSDGAGRYEKSLCSKPEERGHLRPPGRTQSQKRQITKSKNRKASQKCQHKNATGRQAPKLQPFLETTYPKHSHSDNSSHVIPKCLCSLRGPRPPPPLIHLEEAVTCYVSRNITSLAQKERDKYFRAFS